VRRTFEVWFYIGAMLSLYGVMLTIAGLYQWVHPPATVLAGKHATFWAGALMLILGAGYTVWNWPKSGGIDPHNESHGE
jgi:energy-converting hydrogenase Eha subunit E